MVPQRCFFRPWQGNCGFRGLGFRGLGFRGLGSRGLGFRGLGFRVLRLKDGPLMWVRAPWDLNIPTVYPICTLKGL